MSETPANSWRHRLSLKGPLWVSVSLAALIAVELARISVSVFGGHGALPADVSYPRQNVQPRSAAGVDVKEILAAQLFGVAASDSSRDPENSPASTANLVLTGVMAQVGADADNGESNAQGAPPP